MLKFESWPPEPGKVTFTDFALQEASELSFGSLHGQIAAEGAFSQAIPEALVLNLPLEQRTEERAREFFEGGLASQIGSTAAKEILLSGLIAQVRKSNV